MTSTSELHERITSAVDRTVDAVDDLGWDPDGGDPITDSLGDSLRDGTCVEVPPGTYLVDGESVARDLRNWALRGTGDSREEVRFVVPEGDAQRILNVRDHSRNVLVENCTFDQYDAWETCIGNVFQVDDGLLLRDVEYAGRTPSERTGAVSHCNVYVHEPDGEAVVDDFHATGATDLVDYPENVLTLFCGAESNGTLHVRNSRFENCGEHGVYASRCSGAVRIENCYFENNQNTHARISGEGSWVKGSTFVWDVADHPNRGGFQGQTGLTFEAGEHGYSGGLVEGCEFVCRSSGPNSGCLKVDGSHGGITVRDCAFRVDADGAEPIWVDAPGDSHMIDGAPDAPHDVHLENVTVEGAGAGTRDGHRAAITVQARSGSSVRGGRIRTPNRDGIRLTAGDYTVDGTVIEVGGVEIDAEEATVTVTDPDEPPTWRGPDVREDSDP